MVVQVRCVRKRVWMYSVSCLLLVNGAGSKVALPARFQEQTLALPLLGKRKVENRMEWLRMAGETHHLLIKRKY